MMRLPTVIPRVHIFDGSTPTGQRFYVCGRHQPPNVEPWPCIGSAEWITREAEVTCEVCVSRMLTRGRESELMTEIRMRQAKALQALHTVDILEKSVDFLRIEKTLDGWCVKWVADRGLLLECRGSDMLDALAQVATVLSLENSNGNEKESSKAG